ncbi:MAG: hypothetical protein M3Z25_16370, partial [Actinomycetota bacterium]|nr:hypothetical protein [Actinomycetota bacterium]
PPVVTTCALMARGVRAHVEPLQDAQCVIIESFGTAQQMRERGLVEPQSTVLTKGMGMEDESTGRAGVKPGPA